MNLSTVSFNLNKIVELKQKELGTEDSEEVKLLQIAMQSIGKRISYCKYHYQEFQRNSCDKALLQEHLDSSFDGKSIRVIYEASIIAFLQNLHSLIDSFPYALNLIDNKFEIEDKKVGWNKDFIEKYKSFGYYEKLEGIYSNPIYHKLKGLVNRTKHKHLVRIKNTGFALIFEEFSFYSNGKSKNSNENKQDVNQFLIECYDKLLPDFLTLCNAVEKNKENESLIN